MRWYLFAAAAVAGGAATWGVVERLPGTATASAQTLVQPQRPGSLGSTELRGISIDGGRGLPLAELREAIGTRVGQRIDTAQLARDRDAMAGVLAGRGYLAAKVADPIITYTNGAAYVVFDVERGPMFHLRQVTVTGPGKADAGVVTLVAGDQAIAARITQARATLETALARGGRSAQVEVMLRIDRDQAAVDVELVTR